MSACRIEGCKNIAGLSGTARGLCRSHYYRLIELGSCDAPQKYERNKGRICRAPSCERDAKSGGFCRSHYTAWHRANRGQAKSELARAKVNALRLAEREARIGRPRPEVCEICEGVPSRNGRGIVLDHDHESGSPRGWLCDRYNRTLGLLKDDVGLLHRMAEYLEWGGPPPLAEVLPFRRRA